MRLGEKANQLTAEEKLRQAKHMIAFGEHLDNLRTKAGYNLRALGEKLNVSANYLSEIIRGIKAPTDPIVQQMAQLFNQDEDEMFKILGRAPLKARKLLDQAEELQLLLSALSRLTEEKRDRFMNKVNELYMEILGEIDEETEKEQDKAEQE